ncbi:type II and III secretion system protein family protein [Sphingomonas floccifaciens]|uniref:Type II and III secretion system protein family protein n=1 Tax=Sphingomonas floccifaciens TaxID=1844115 RepID=A0ABW4N803_9SPHN
MRVFNKPIGLPLASCLAVAAIAATPASIVAQTVSRAGGDVLQIATSRGRLVTLSAPITDIFVADDKIADVQVRSPTQLYVFGKAPGETTISATTKSGRVAYATTVRVGNNYDSIGAMLQLALPDAQITATPMNGLVLLTGVVAAPQDAAEAERLVQAFVGEQTKVLSRLKTATPLQVSLQVKFAEVSRSFIKNMGVNFSTVDGTSGFKFGGTQGRLGGDGATFIPGGPLGVGFSEAPAGASKITKGADAATFGLAGKLLGLDVLSAIDIGETAGQVTTLANPNLTALSGETASFLVGGEIPIITQSGLGASSVQFKEYGVSLTYTPTVLSDGRISLRVRPEVSQLSSAGAVSVGGVSIPALTTRRTETTVELGSGQSFMIAGLLQNSHDNSITKTPGIGDVPVLGALFRSNAFRRNETELVIIITPYLVKPVNANDIVLPTDGYRGPTDADRLFMGTLAKGTSGADRPKPQMATPSAPPPSAGAMSPTPVAPLPAPVDSAVEVKAVPPVKDKSKKGAAPMPGFSFK